MDSGALRCGIAVLDYGNAPYCVHSEIFGVVQGERSHQEYRMALIVAFSVKAISLAEEYEPDIVVSEIIPPIGMGGVQALLAATAVTAFLAVLINKGYKVDQIAASTVKKALTGSGRATKAQVRDASLLALGNPADLQDKLMGNKTISDESDSIAVGLAYGNLRYKWDLNGD